MVFSICWPVLAHKKGEMTGLATDNFWYHMNGGYARPAVHQLLFCKNKGIDYIFFDPFVPIPNSWWLVSDKAHCGLSPLFDVQSAKFRDHGELGKTKQLKHGVKMALYVYLYYDMLLMYIYILCTYYYIMHIICACTCRLSNAHTQIQARIPRNVVQPKLSSMILILIRCQGVDEKSSKTKV